MKLHVFETCPYCMRARIFAGLKGLDPEIATAAPGIIPAGLRGRIERMMVPILEDNGLILQDSGAIIQYLDRQDPLLADGYETSPAFEAWRAQLAPVLNALCYPRIPHLNVAELSVPAARAFFEAEMPRRIGMSFQDALSNTGGLSEQAAAHLPAAAEFLDPDAVRFDTLAALADLQSLTMVAELEWPEATEQRFQTLMERAGISPFASISQYGSR